jgi:hypothetical protein
LEQPAPQTDESPSYKPVSCEFAAHERANCHQGIYVRDGVSTSRLGDYFSQLKRSIDGTHHHVSREHLPRCPAEFDFRSSTRDMTDSQRATSLLGRSDCRRLVHKLCR